LNSWQSFKNRCDAAQRKQKIWLSTGEGKSTGQSLLKTQLNGHSNQLKPAIENAQQKFKETQVELQRKKLQQLVQQQQAKHQLDTSFIKSEPATDDDVSPRYSLPNLANAQLFFRRKKMSWSSIRRSFWPKTAVMKNRTLTMIKAF
jgi:hypothetical protein